VKVAAGWGGPKGGRECPHDRQSREREERRGGRMEVWATGLSDREEDGVELGAKTVPGE
jgi:hypothetical protein